MTNIAAQLRRTPGWSAASILLVAIGFALLVGATIALWRPWDRGEREQLAPVSAPADAQKSLVPSDAGDGWSVALNPDAGPLAGAIAALRWLDHGIDLIDPALGRIEASIQLSSYPMAIRRQSVSELLVSDKRFDGGESARLLIFDTANGMALKRQISLDPDRGGYTSYFSQIALNGAESVLFYVSQSTRSELPECDGRAQANVCDKITVGAVDLAQPGTQIAAAELPVGCPPPRTSPSANPQALILTCHDGRAFEATTDSATVTLQALPIVDVPVERELPATKDRPTDALYTVWLPSGGFGTLFSDGTFVQRGLDGDSLRATPDGMRPLRGGDDIHVLHSGRVLIAVGRAHAVVPDAVVLFDPVAGRIDRIIDLDAAEALAVLPDEVDGSLLVITRSGVLQRFSLADGRLQSQANIGVVQPEEISLVP